MTKTTARCVLGGLMSLFLLSASPTALSADPSPQVAFSVQPLPLFKALNVWARQAKCQLIWPAGDPAEERMSEPLIGTYAPEQALAKLLDGSGLQFQFLDKETVEIRRPKAGKPGEAAGAGSTGITIADEGPEMRLARADGNGSDSGTGEGNSSAADGRSAGEGKAQASDRKSEGNEAQEIVVTGTNIRGVQPSSPLVTITQEDMRLSGHYNVGEALRTLPQNFSGGQNPGVRGDAGAGGTVNQNLTGSSGPNLRGLGPDATLTLLNGVRLPYDGDRQATDVSNIPAAAIDRVEVLLDGASAVYGSDAVGGVANIILKRDYQGAELSARYGMATDGGYEQQQYTALGGRSWGSGGFLITGDFSRNTAIRADQRDYLNYIPRQNSQIYYAYEQAGGLFSGHQVLGGGVEFVLDAFYTDRSTNPEYQLSSTSDVRGTRDIHIWSIAAGLRLALPSNWSSWLRGAMSGNKMEFDSESVNFTSGAVTSPIDRTYDNKASSVEAGAEGPVFRLPGGEARLAIGGGYRETSLDRVDRLGTGARVDGERRSNHAYGEISLPLVSENQSISWVRELSFTGAVRYEDYSDFGHVTTPKAGAIWGVSQGFNIKASWGKSFKAPALSQQYADRQAALYDGNVFGVSTPGSTVLRLFGGNPDLGPERAQVITAGMVASPGSMPGFTVEINWFDIDYTNRVAQPISPLTQALTNPLFSQFVMLNPTVAQQNVILAGVDQLINASSGGYNAANVVAVIQGGDVNATRQKISGLDLAVRHAIDTSGGKLSLSGSASWLDSKRNITESSPAQSTSGAIYFPPDFRARAGVSWSREGFTLTGAVNHIDGVKDTTLSSSPKGDAMTTIDLVVDHELSAGPFGGFNLNVAVANVLNEYPPFLAPVVPYNVNYDSTNYSAIGRTISATVTKRF